MKKINLKGISEILSQKEMKNVMGGSDYGGGDFIGGGSARFFCGHGSSAGGGITGCLFTADTALEFCLFWHAAGHNCSCSRC